MAQAWALKYSPEGTMNEKQSDRYTTDFADKLYSNPTILLLVLLLMMAIRRGMKGETYLCLLYSNQIFWHALGSEPPSDLFAYQ